MKRQVRDGLSDEELEYIALGYDDLSVFQKEDHVTYSIICERGLRKKLCAHMKRHTAESMSDEELAEVALRYDVAREFREKEPSAYRAIQERGLLKELCGHMQREARDLTNDELGEIASQYDVLKDLREADEAAYILIRRRGLFDELCGHMERGCDSYTDEELAERAQAFKHRIDFWRNDRKAYDIARMRGMLDKICAHMKPLADFTKRKIYVFTFSDGYAYVGLTHNIKERYKSHTTGGGHSPVYRHITETGASFKFEVLTEWMDIEDVGKLEDDYIKKYASDGWKMLNKMKGGALGWPKRGMKKRK